ncbi:MAG: dihydrodipicolinate synthase family protein, partial [Candidatus Latescibacteria bacterium]|nr:dihydrodipicolinate synthase family protein [Candidatus Latescibacterota bacterium]
MFRPQGIYPAMMTPFDDRGEIHEPVVRDIVDFVIEKGVDGIFPVSTCGEFVHMDLGQRKRLMELVVDQNRGRVPITPGIGATCPNQSIELAEYAKQLRCDAVVLLAPYFFLNTQDIVEKYVEVVARAVDIPLILYNIPFFTNPILPDTVEKLCSLKNIVAMKDSSGNMINLLNNIDQARKVDSDFHV